MRARPLPTLEPITGPFPRGSRRLFSGRLALALAALALAAPIAIAPAQAPPLECFGKTPTKTGTTRDDTLTGRPDRADVIVGLDGNDTIRGLGGGDRLCGDRGDADDFSNDLEIDTIFGGGGADKLDGNGGFDVLNGGRKRDVLLAGGADEPGSQAPETAEILEKINTLDGGPGNDVLRGQAANDRIFGGGGEDDIFGGGSGDVIEGGDEEPPLGDEILPGPGSDTTKGGAGRDFILEFDSGDPSNPDENTIFGGRANDDIEGSDVREVVFGGGGDDKIEGFRGNDEISGGAGDDQRGLFGGPGDDTIFGDDGDDRLFGEADNDTLDGGPEEDGDECDGGGGEDTFIDCENVEPSSDPNDLEVEVRPTFEAVPDEGPQQWTVRVLNQGPPEAGPAEDVRVDFEVEEIPVFGTTAETTCDRPGPLFLGDVGTNSEVQFTLTCEVERDLDDEPFGSVCVTATATGSDGSRGAEQTCALIRDTD